MKHGSIAFDHICSDPDCVAVPCASSRGLGVGIFCRRCKFVSDAEALLTEAPEQELMTPADVAQRVREAHLP